MAGVNPSQDSTTKAKTRKKRAWLLAVPQALGMALLARSCALGAAALSAALPWTQSGPWWSQIPGWLALVWISKQAARTGWWSVEAAWVFCGGALAISAAAALQGAEWMGTGWLAACLWACLWPKARRRALEIDRLEAAKAEAKRQGTPASGRGAR